jgi:predicted AAA+ superfamily ATPase
MLFISRLLLSRGLLVVIVTLFCLFVYTNSIFTAKMLTMFTRLLIPPEQSFFLFGPRGTGKTTWLRGVFPEAVWFDLLRTQTLLDLMRRPEMFRQQVEARPGGSWVVVDEVQRLPAILNEVQALMTEHGKAYRFALSGSSARKLRRSDANLLAGRAINRQFFPLTAAEIGHPPPIDEILRHGLLPQIRMEPDLAVDFLDAYVANYIREEIQQEALVRNLDSFARFLEVAALVNGQVVNVAGLARDAGVARPTVQGYFATLVDTLLGTWVPAWRKRVKVKEVSGPKFYLFDPGVARALAGRLREPLDGAERGFLLETWVLHELRSAMAFLGIGGQISYWRTPSGSEVDFIWSRAARAIGIEVKAAATWRREYGAPLKGLIDAGAIQEGYGVYTGNAELKDGPLRVMPLDRFLNLLAEGRVLTSPEP